MNLDNIHLSSSGLSLYSTKNSVGFISSVFAYKVKKLYTFFIVPINLLWISFNPSISNLVGVHGGETYSKYHLNASAPYWSNNSIGFTVFPLDLLIFLPSLSSTRSGTKTLLYGAFPNTNVDTASNE